MSIGMKKRPSTEETEQNKPTDKAAEQIANEQPSKESVSGDSTGELTPTGAVDSTADQRPDAPSSVDSIKNPAKNPAAVSLGRLGGLKGGKARARTLTKTQRSEAARKAALARWRKKKQTN